MTVKGERRLAREEDGRRERRSRRSPGSGPGTGLSSAAAQAGEHAVDRRLSVVLVADVAGYSRLMADDETGTFRRLKAFRERVVEPALGRYGGRVVKAMGDGLLVEFDDAVAAVECAVEIQDALRRAEARRSARRRIALRIGINLGEVIVEDGDIFGTPVNVAARLEALAEPGGIAISGAAYWAVKERVRHGFEEMGFLRLRNIPHPIEAYRIASPRLAEAGEPAALAPVRHVWSDREAPHPSVVVLPFDNLSDDPAQDFFCDGLTMELTTDLARFSNLLVIDRSSAVGVKRQHMTPADLRRALGVEYLVEGGVQRLGRHIHIAARLLATAGNRQLWADTITRDVEDLFELQADVAAKIAGSLGARLGILERMRVVPGATGDVGAYEAFLQGLHAMSRFLEVDETPLTLEQCRSCLEQALAIDERHARAWGWLAYSHVQGWLHGWVDEGALQTAEELARKAIALDASDHDTHWALGSVLSNAGRYEEAMAEYERALELNPNDADLHAEMAELISFMGRHADAIDRIRFAMRLNPLFPAWYRWVMGWCCYFIGAYDQALEELDRLPHAVDEALLIRAASHAQLARRRTVSDNAAPPQHHACRARDNIRLFLERRPGWTLERQRDVTKLRIASDVDHWLEGLRLAGLPRN